MPSSLHGKTRYCDCGFALASLWQSGCSSISFLVCPNCEQLTVVVRGKQPKWLVHELKNDVLQRWQQGKLHVEIAKQRIPSIATSSPTPKKNRGGTK